MAKGFPYFKFVATEWLTGDIVFEDYDLQGIFINVCAIYWHRNGDVTIDELVKRLKTDRLYSLSPRFISIDNGKISIAFLDEQLQAANHISKKNSDNGKLGGRPKTLNKKPTANRTITDRKAKKSKEEKEEEIKEEKEEEYKDIRFNFLTSLINSGADKKLSEAWMAVRKTKKATNSEQAFKLFYSEVQKSGLNIDQVLEICIKKDWKGFEAKWVKDFNNNKDEYTNQIRQHGQGLMLDFLGINQDSSGSGNDLLLRGDTSPSE